LRLHAHANVMQTPSSQPGRRSNHLGGVARAALAELRRRDALDAHRAAAEGRAEQLARWHEQDLAAEVSVPDRTREAEPALGIGSPWD
jgi:hypothetical protein